MEHSSWTLLWLLGISYVLYLAIHYGLLPRMEKQLVSQSLPVRLARSGALAALKFASEVLLIAVIVYATFAFVALILSSAFGNNVTLLSWVVDLRRRGEGSTRQGEVRLWTNHVCVLCGRLCFFCYGRIAPRRLSDQTRSLYESEEDRLNLERETDPEAWASVPPNEIMLALARPSRVWRGNWKSSRGKKFHHERVSRLRAIKALQEKRVREDYQRRMDTDRIEAALKASEGRTPWDLLFSKGFLRRYASGLEAAEAGGHGDRAGGTDLAWGTLLA